MNCLIALSLSSLSDNILLLLSLLVFIALLLSKIGFRFGMPLMVLFLALGMFAGEDGLGLTFDNEDSFDANISSLATATQMSETELSGTISAILEMRSKDIDKTTETRLFYMTDKMDEILSRIGSR